MTKAFDYAVRKHGNKQCLGTREVLAEEDEMQDTGKVGFKFSFCPPGNVILDFQRIVGTFKK